MLTGDYERQICADHDRSKSDPEEYHAYDAYFYGQTQSYFTKNAFDKAWLRHIHKNEHHWQHWVLINDDPNEGEIILEIPYNYIVEMICDWWSFSFKQNDLYSVFTWYNEHKQYIKLNEKTRLSVEYILKEINKKLVSI